MKAKLAYQLHRLGEYNKYLVAQLGAVGVFTGTLLGLGHVLPTGVTATLTLVSAQTAAIGVWAARNQDTIDELGDRAADILER
jgi:hypothetical protein